MAVGTGCPTPNELGRLLSEELADADRCAVESHVQTCAACQEQLESMVGNTLPQTRPTAIIPADGLPNDELAETFLNRLKQLPLPSLPAPAARAAEERVQGALGPYEILGRLGRGGMGTVYRARHRELDKIVALKVLPADRVDEAAVARFRNEMKATGRLAHLNIVAAHDAGRVGGTYYLAMDFVDGTDLSGLIEQFGPLSVPDACELIRQAAVGLQHACECGLAHRDVKPSNLMLSRGGEVKVLDLGLARSLADLPEPDRLTATGMVVGTADYIAPEQIDQAHTADARADVYGLGGTFYFLLTGTPPFAGYRSWLEKLRAHAEAAIPSVRDLRPEVPAALVSLIEQMLAKAPDDRPATPGEVAAALQEFAAGSDLTGLLARGGLASPPRPMPTPTPRPRRKRKAILRYALAGVAGAAIALLAASPFLARREQKPEVTGEPPPVTPHPAKAEEKPDTDEPEGIRLTYGPGGPPRADHRVLPGEEVCVEYVVRGVGKSREGEVDVTMSGELVDHADKKWTELAASPRKGPLYRDGAPFSGYLSYNLSMQQPPGEYRARARLTDKVTGRSVNFEQPVYVLRPEFGVIRLRLTHDEDGKLPAGANLTVGQGFYVHLGMVNFARDGNRVHLVVKVSARDRDGKETTPEPMQPTALNREVPDGNKIDLIKPLRTIMAGEAFITVEVEDRLAQKSAKYELPVLIHPPRSIRPPAK